MNIPNLSHANRSREYNSHPQRLTDTVVYEYLFQGKTHRWIDENVLGFNAQYS